MPTLKRTAEVALMVVLFPVLFPLAALFALLGRMFLWMLEYGEDK